MYDRRRREFATSDLIKMMPANCKILLMAQNERGGIMREVQVSREEFFGPMCGEIEFFWRFCFFFF